MKLVEWRAVERAVLCQRRRMDINVPDRMARTVIIQIL